MTIKRTFKEAVKARMMETREPYMLARKFVIEHGGGKHPGIFIGVNETGKRIYWNPQETPHLLVGGQPGSGKTFFLKYLIDQKKKSDALIAFIDLKKRQTPLIEDIWRSAQDISSAKTIILEAWEIMETRYQLMQTMVVNNYKHLPDAPAIFVVIDEFNSNLIEENLNQDSKDISIEKALQKVLMLGRAAGVHIVIAIQDTKVVPDSLNVHIDARLALGNMNSKLYDLITYLEPTEVPLVTEKRFREGTLRVGTLIEKIIIPDIVL